MHLNKSLLLDKKILKLTGQFIYKLAGRLQGNSQRHAMSVQFEGWLNHVYKSRPVAPLTLRVSVVNGGYLLDDVAVSAGIKKLAIGTTVRFTGIPKEHPLQILGPSGDSSMPGRHSTMTFSFTQPGLHSMHCEIHGYMGGKNAFDIGAV